MEITSHHRALVGLMQVPGFGVRMARNLLNQSGVENAEDCFNMIETDLLKIDGLGRNRISDLLSFDDWDSVDKVLERTVKLGARLVALTDPDYPPMLKQTYDPPVILWVRGDVAALSKEALAVVGTRNPGSYGLSETERWSKKLVAAGLSVNSGLAYGVDAKAHRTALEQEGTTVAVMGSGIDWVYPAKNRRLADQIIKNGGALITEYPPGSKPDAVNFPERNRIVSGLSYGVLVVESGIKGGSMITARLALDQNREVFVVPHPLGYLKGEGCNYLIRTGQGKLVQTFEHVLEELSIRLQKGENEKAAAKPAGQKWKEAGDLTEQETALCRTLSNETLHVDQLAEKLDTQPFKLSPLLLELEMKGLIRQKAGKYFELE